MKRGENRLENGSVMKEKDVGINRPGREELGLLLDWR